ncbi:hypothetical protein GCM10020218_042700 [Dactylosporangium vinaceum]
MSVSPLPPVTTELRSWIITNVRELHGLREALLETLEARHLVAAPAFDDRADRVLLVASELATNALVHGLPPSVVRLLLADDCFLIDIADHDMQAVPELRDVEPYDSGGRGLHLARQLSLDVGWYATADAKHIWASFPAVTTRG